MPLPWFSRDPIVRASGAALVAVLLATVPARAQGPGRTNKAATAHYNKGVELYGDGDRKAALEEFKRAYEIQPNFRQLLNIAQIQLQMEDWSGAYASFQRYLADGGSRVTPERRAQVDGELKKLAARLEPSASPVLASAATAPASAAPASAAPTTAATSAAPTSAGPASAASASGAPGAAGPAASGASGSGAPGAASATPAASASPTEAARSSAEAARDKGAAAPPYWIGWAVAGALGAGAVATGVLAMQATSRYDDKLKSFGVSRDDLDGAQGKARTLVIVTGALAGAAAVSAGITLYMQLARKPAREAPKESRLELLFGPGSVGARGSF